jgi:hypothetical protein
MYFRFFTAGGKFLIGESELADPYGQLRYYLLA